MQKQTQSSIKTMIVVGARPNFMKAAPLISAIRQHNKQAATTLAATNSDPVRPINNILVHTGQHYDAQMSDSFFADLDLPRPDIQLGVGSASHAIQTAEIMRGFEPVLMREQPDIVVVVGDVNSTLACALVTAKISFDSNGKRPILAHVEAGLRSSDRSMPEEVNRVLTDHLADLLFVTEESAIQNLLREGVSSSVIHFVGNTMIDSVLAFKEKAEQSTILEQLGLRATADSEVHGTFVRRYALLTLHRPSNVDNQETFLNILTGLDDLVSNYPVIFPTHPRTQDRIRKFGLAPKLGLSLSPHDATHRTVAPHNGLIFTEPLGYLEFLCLMKNAMIVITDSGGIQEETTCLGIPCVTVRENTERPVTVEKGTNLIAGTSTEKIAASIRQQLSGNNTSSMPEKWDGQAASRIISTLIDKHQEQILARHSS